MNNKRLKNDPLAWIGNEEKEESLKTPKLGRPQTIKREYTKSSQEGLKENWTRYTVIIREDLLERLKNNVKDQDKTMKTVVNEMIEGYLNDREA